jgi:hypothetical protein
MDAISAHSSPDTETRIKRITEAFEPFLFGLLSKDSDGEYFLRLDIGSLYSYPSDSYYWTLVQVPEAGLYDKYRNWLNP